MKKKRRKITNCGSKIHFIRASSSRKLENKRIIWSVRIGIGWRALEVMKKNENKIAWFWVGSHAEYDNLLKKN